MRILLFGLGQLYQRYKILFRDEELVALLDNDKKKQGNLIDGIPVLSPEDGVKQSFDRIYILSKYVKEMRKQLYALHVSSDKIFDLDHDVHRFKRLGLSFYETDSGVFTKSIRMTRPMQRQILLISFDMSLTGAQIALVYVARILASKGYDITVASHEDGLLVKYFEEIGITVLIDRDLAISRLIDLPWVRDFDLVFLNTVRTGYLLTERDASIPVIWWLHEPEMLYSDFFIADQRIFLDDLQKISATNLFVYAVGPIAKNAFKKCCKDIFVQTLLYGIVDKCSLFSGNQADSSKVIFALIGGISKLKGHDVFLEAIRLVNAIDQEQCEFWMIGIDTSAYGEFIRNQAKPFSNVKIFGELEHNEMDKIYEKIDVLVCPSRADTMPIVVTEAMQHYKPCIVSSCIGSAHFIKEKQNGLLCKTEDARDLAEKMIWLLEHPTERVKMGIEARKIYDQYFSMKIFEKNLIHAVENVL